MAQKMLRPASSKGRWLSANGGGGFLYPANSVGDDDIEVYSDEIAQRRSLTTLASPCAMQNEKPVVDGINRPNQLPRRFHRAERISVSSPITSVLFAVTVRRWLPTRSAKAVHEAANWMTTAAIMIKALADRLAEAFAERLHQRVRKEFWGFVPDEALTNPDLIAEKYRGIRPAPGYPACPDHTVKAEMFRVLNCAEIGMGLTESLAMTPAASVSGFYLAHAEAAYFNVGKIGEDQLLDWAERSAQDPALVRRSLAALV